MLAPMIRKLLRWLLILGCGWGFRIRHFFHEKLPLWIAMHLPARVAMWAFIRVHSLSGEGPSCDGEYKKAHDLWSKKYGIR